MLRHTMRNKLAVKICGMNSQTAIDAAIASGVDYLGFVFFPPSPRSLTPEIASSLMEKRSDDFKVVAVVVNPSNKLLEEITNHLAPDIFQLHGSERGFWNIGVGKSVKIVDIVGASYITIRVSIRIILE